MYYKDKSIAEFISLLSGSSPVPGGGGAAALTGAIGAALGGMVASLTQGKKKYAEYEEEILRLKEKCESIENELLHEIDRDAEGFEPLSKVYKIPKDDPKREELLEKATVDACAAPMEIMELCAGALEAVKVLAEKGSTLVVSDAAAGALILKAALQAAALNVFINTKSLKDREAAERMNRRCLELIARYGALADAIYGEVLNGFLD